MNIQETILENIERLEREISALSRQQQALISQLDTLYYVANYGLDAPVIICHGTEEHCRQYMRDNYPLGAWYHGSSQFSPMHNPNGINWAILHSVTKAEKREWNAIQAFIDKPNQETAWEIIAMWRDN